MNRCEKYHSMPACDRHFVVHVRNLPGLPRPAWVVECFGAVRCLQPVITYAAVCCLVIAAGCGGQRQRTIIAVGQARAAMAGALWRVNRGYQGFRACCFSDTSRNRPLIALPAQIWAPAGYFSIVADYEHAERARWKQVIGGRFGLSVIVGGVPVYLINRTGRPLVLDTQDGDVYLKLEYEIAPGVWRRAEPHYYNSCGNAYDRQVVMLPESFIRVIGYQPPEHGRPARVRYALYGQEFLAESNAGAGQVNDTDIVYAANDLMNVYCGTPEYVRAVAEGRITLRRIPNVWRDARREAVDWMETLAERAAEQQRQVEAEMRRRRPGG